MHDLAPGSQFASDVRAGLTQPEQKTLGCRYLYDDMGWALREAIALLPEYGLTRADARIIEAHADDLLDCLPSPLTIAELGSGSVATTRTIPEAVRKRQNAVYYPIDVPATALARCARELGPLAAVHPLEMSFQLLDHRPPSSRRPGLPPGKPQSELNVVQAAIGKQIPGDLDLHASLIPLQERMVGDVRQGLVLLMAAVGAVLLVLCVNLANLGLARRRTRPRFGHSHRPRRQPRAPAGPIDRGEHYPGVGRWSARRPPGLLGISRAAGRRAPRSAAFERSPYRCPRAALRPRGLALHRPHFWRPSRLAQPALGPRGNPQVGRTRRHGGPRRIARAQPPGRARSRSQSEEPTS